MSTDERVCGLARESVDEQMSKRAGELMVLH